MEELLLANLNREINNVKRLKMNFMDTESGACKEDEEVFDYIIREKEYTKRELEERLISKKNGEPKESRIKVLDIDQFVVLAMTRTEPEWFAFEMKGEVETKIGILKSFNSEGRALEYKDTLPPGLIYGIFKKI